MEHYDYLLKDNNLFEYISSLRKTTKCYYLIKYLCECVLKNTKMDLTRTFWNDYSISLYYTNNIKEANKCYENIFTQSITSLSEDEVNFYINNMKFSDNFKNEICVKFDDIINTKLKFINMTDNVKSLIDANFNPLNPSIIKYKNGYKCVVRSVNYKFDDNYKYIWEGVCMTKNYIIDFDSDMNIVHSEELQLPSMISSGFMFDGWEDIRLFMYNDEICCSFTSLQTNHKRIQTMCMAQLKNPSEYIVLDQYGSGKIQKNWVPLVNNKNLYFIYSFYPLTILKYDENLKKIKLHQVTKLKYANKWHGGTPAISLESLGYPDHYICIIHISKFPKYEQKFVIIKTFKNENDDDIFNVIDESPLFYFIDESIEFCSGITISHDKKRFIITFGKMDRNIYCIEVECDKIMNLFVNLV